jgi:hypothetical protein
MTQDITADPQNTPSTQSPPDGSSSSPSGSNPLDQLEELIKNAQSRAGQPSGDGEQFPVQGVNPDEEAQQLAEEEKQKLEQIEQMKMQKAEEEKKLVLQQQQLIQQNATESVQAKNRATAKEEEAKDREPIADSFLIRQLDHIKIKKPVE